MMNEPISSIMTRELLTVGPNDTVDKVYELLTSKGIHHIPVQKDGILVGLLTTYDLFKRGLNKKSAASIVVKDIMTKKLATLEPTAKVGTAAEIFLEHLFHAIPIVNGPGKKLVGIVTTHDVMKYSYRKEYPKEIQKTL